MSEATGHEREGREYAFETARLGIWCFLATEVLLFGGLFTAYTVFRIRYPELFHAEHLKLDRVLGATNTVILITSSLTMAMAVDAARHGKRERLQLFLLLTVLFAGGFLGVKYLEWSAEIAHHRLPGTNIFFSLYYPLTGLHGLHVLGGMGVLVWLLVRARQGELTRTHHTPVEIGGLYWHFVDLVWIYLFPLLYLVG